MCSQPLMTRTTRVSNAFCPICIVGRAAHASAFAAALLLLLLLLLICCQPEAATAFAARLKVAGGVDKAAEAKIGTGVAGGQQGS